MIRENMEMNANGLSSVKKRAALGGVLRPMYDIPENDKRRAARKSKEEEEGRIKSLGQRGRLVYMWRHSTVCMFVYLTDSCAGWLILTVFNLQSCSHIWCINKKGHIYFKGVPSC